MNGTSDFANGNDVENGKNGECCYFCDERHQLERHHIVPQRFDGADTNENIVSVCPTCHSKLEDLYDKRFYNALGVDTPNDVTGKACETCGNPAHGQVKVSPEYDTKFLCTDCAGDRGFMMAL